MNKKNLSSSQLTNHSSKSIPLSTNNSKTKKTSVEKSDHRHNKPILPTYTLTKKVYDQSIYSGFNPNLSSDKLGETADEDTLEIKIPTPYPQSVININQ